MCGRRTHTWCGCFPVAAWPRGNGSTATTPRRPSLEPTERPTSFARAPCWRHAICPLMSDSSSPHRTTLCTRLRSWGMSRAFVLPTHEPGETAPTLCELSCEVRRSLTRNSRRAFDRFRGGGPGDLAAEAEEGRQEHEGGEHAAGDAQGQHQAQAGQAAVRGDHERAEAEDGRQGGDHDAAAGGRGKEVAVALAA